MAARLTMRGYLMKKDRKRRKEAVRRLEELEYMNKARKSVTSISIVAALYPKFLLNMFTGERNQETCAEILREVKSLVDIKDYITCPRSMEKKAIHIGDRVYKAGGDGEPLIVEEIIIRDGGSMVRCRYAEYSDSNPSEIVRKITTRPVFFSRELTFDKPVNNGLYDKLNECWGRGFKVTIVEEI